MDDCRRVLFLLGPTSPLWRELARGFEDAGHATHKILFSSGDVLWWRWRGGTVYWGTLSRWKDFLADYMRRHGITDLIYYADRHPYHIVAQRVARDLGVQPVVIENGYLRPDWLTVEIGGMGVYSRFPKDPDEILRHADCLPAPDLTVRYRHGYWREVISEISHHSISEALRFLHPFFRHGHYYHPWFEYLAGIPHVIGADRRAREAEEVVADLEASRRTFFLLALQMQGDHQIHSNSPFRHIGTMMEDVIASFAAHAPADALLVLKQHPYDNGWENWKKRMTAAATRHGVADRTLLIDGGDLHRLLAIARGCIVVNSTVGLHALRAGCPTKTLGIAIYDMPGLTHQGGLDGFWQEPGAIDQALLDAFVRLLADRIQVKGSFYHPQGRSVAVEEIVRRVCQRRVGGEGCDILPPPRLDDARRLGIPVDHSI
ncbi:Capsule polysaccharide biosynthesis protein [Hartmannibacter diazotrophicus]|uniref:Capsule polysaccharide biosynthesis protein n=1 Tax=Hartmannibacter diazotrophicus TaxID=1482074 RepID=A0A2C9D2K7_9HYPH|nr:capsular biosynthesis protein [Hartmannibacter diazotrophicus]SON54490.1 Capsule polysaccharide biosynthesis protein [Hartmannibacter diazotrophicus]